MTSSAVPLPPQALPVTRTSSVGVSDFSIRAQMSPLVIGRPHSTRLPAVLNSLHAAMLAACLFALWPPAVAAQSPVRSRLAKYLVEYRPTKLEWDLTQANLAWAGAFGPGSGSYAHSGLIIFRPDLDAFWTAFTVHERPDDGVRAFSSLAALEKRAALQKVIDQLIGILKPSFPEIERHPGLVMAEFWYYGNGGGRIVVAKYENGRLDLQ